MILLNHSLEAVTRFQPESMALNLEERNSTATITLGPEAPELKINDWVKDETEPGAGIVWRVKTVSESVETQTRTVSLDHVIQYLKDFVLFGDVQPKTITGNNKSTTCTARQALEYALNRQALWRLGDLGENPSNPYSFNGDTVFAALETVTGSLEDVQWEYDLRRLPFIVHIRKQPTGFQSEMRMRRNITTMRIQVDRTRMYTRLYPIGKNDLHIDGEYVSKNEGVWGTVCKVETESSKEDKTALRAWAVTRLENHCEPLVTVTVTGLELSAATGEALDHIVVGRRCRMPLPDYGVSMTERVTKLSWADKIKEPEKVTVTLANNVEDVASIVNSLASSSASSSRRQATKDGEDHAWMVDTEDHVGLVAEALAGEGADKDWSRVSSIMVDGEGIHQRVVRTEGDIVTAFAAIEINENAITLEAQRATEAEGTLTGKIEVEAGRITAEVTRAMGAEGTLQGKINVDAGRTTAEVTRAMEAELQLQGKILVQADSVSMVVNQGSDTREIKYYENRSDFPQTGSTLYRYYDLTNRKYYEWAGYRYQEITPGTSIAASEICTSINQSGETQAVINASKIYLLGETIANRITADYINTKIASIPTLSVSAITASGSIHASSVEANNLYIIASDSQGHQTNVSVKNAVKELQIVAVDTTTYKLQKKSYSDADWVDVGSFSRATSTTLSGSWSGGTFTVTASPQGKIITAALFDLTSSDISWNGNTATCTVYANLDGGETKYDTGKRLTVNATPRYNAGFDADHQLFCAVGSGSSAESTATVAPGKTVNIWPGFVKSDGSNKQWGAVCAVTATTGTRFTLECTEKEQTYPGSSLYNYTFTLSGAGNTFNKGTNYDFYRH